MVSTEDGVVCKASPAVKMIVATKVAAVDQSGRRDTKYNAGNYGSSSSSNIIDQHEHLTNSMLVSTMHSEATEAARANIVAIIVIYCAPAAPTIKGVASV